MGTWKIADMGLAKHHVAATRARGPTSTRHGTPSYEPPEAFLNTSSARSRLYDIWSMGCITLELIIWLLYGYDELNKFNGNMKNTLGQPKWYWERVNGSNVARVHPNVAACIAHIKRDPECQIKDENGNEKKTAISELIQLVETKLLVVPLPPNSKTPEQDRNIDADVTNTAGPSLKVTRPDSEAPDASVPSPTLGQFRATAKNFHEILLNIQLEGKKRETYLFTGKSRKGVTGPPLDEPKLLPQSVPRKVDLIKRLSESSEKSSDNYEYLMTRSSLVWEFPVDNVFATTVLGDGRLWEKVMQPSSQAAQLCRKCSKTDFWAGEILFTEEVSSLERESSFCEFCSLRWSLCKRFTPAGVPTVLFDRLESTLRLNESYPPVLTIQRGPGMSESDLIRTILDYS